MRHTSIQIEKNKSHTNNSVSSRSVFSDAEEEEDEFLDKTCSTDTNDEVAMKNSVHNFMFHTLGKNHCFGQLFLMD